MESGLAEVYARILTMFDTDNEILEIVDSADNVTGSATRADIHRKGLLHRAVHIFLFNSRGEIYVQRRSSLKDRFPLLMDSSAAGHVDPGESYEQAARRELQEEIAIEAEVEQLFRVGASEVTDNEHVVLFRAASDALPVPDAGEVQWGGFVTQQELTQRMEAFPEDFVPAFVYLWKEFRRRE